MMAILNVLTDLVPGLNSPHHTHARELHTTHPSPIAPIDPRKPIALRPPHTSLPDQFAPTHETLNTVVNLVDILLPAILVRVKPNVVALLPVIVSFTQNPHLKRLLQRPRHHELHLDDGRPHTRTNLAEHDLATGTLTCLADLDAVPRIVKTPLIVMTLLAARALEIAAVTVNPLRNAVVHHQCMDLLLIHLVHHATVQACSDFAAVHVHIHIAPLPDPISC